MFGRSGFVDSNGVVTDTLSGQNALFLQTPSAIFMDATSTTLPPDSDATKLVELADVDHESGADIFFINVSIFYPNPVLRLYMNSGSGTFSDETLLRIPFLNFIFLNDGLFRDFNDDTWLDLYIANVDLGTPKDDFFLVNENGYFVDASRRVPNRLGFCTSVVSRDINGDNQPDIFVSCGDGSGGIVLDKLYKRENLVWIGEKQNSTLPHNFVLLPAYPNPFNPSMTLRFALPVSSKMTLQIFDGLGRRVAQPLSDSFAPGFHSLVWQPKNLAEGVYFLRFSAYPNDSGQMPVVLHEKLLLLK